MAAVLACLVAPGAALAWELTGSVVCGDTTVGVQGVQVTIGYAGHPEYSFYPTSTDVNGNFAVVVPDSIAETGASVHLVYGTYVVDFSVPYTVGQPLGTFSIPAEWCGGGDGGECTASIEVSAFCHKPFTGGADKECNFALSGSVSVGGDTSSNGIATTDADFAIVKSGSGGCPQGQSSYNVILGPIIAGQTQLTSGNGQGISHVTYCGCP